MIRQAHPGPGARPYRTFEQKMYDGERFKNEDDIQYPVVVDDLKGSTHQVYGGNADPTYLIDADGRVAFYNMFTHAPTLDRAITALIEQGGQGVVNGGIDRTPHMLASMTNGWRGLRRGFPQSWIEMDLAMPGSGTSIWMAHQLRPLLAPIALRGKPLPVSAKIALAVGAGALIALAMSALFRDRDTSLEGK